MMYFTMKCSVRYLSLLLLLVTPLAAQTSAEWSASENFNNADVVLRGDVLDLETSLEVGRSVIEYRVAVEETFKGEVLFSPVQVRAYGSPGLLLGERVLLFLGRNPSTSSFDILHFHHLGEERSETVDRALLAGPHDKACSPDSSGTAIDPVGDSEPNALVSPSPDLVAATASSNGTEVAITVLYEPSTFDPVTTRFRLYIDIDQDPTTGFAGILGHDTSLFGTEFIIATDGNSTQVRKHDPTSPPGGSQFDIIAMVPVTVLADGFRTVIPLNLLDNDDLFAFKAYSDVHSGGLFTSETDYVPDLGLAPARTQLTGDGVVAPSNLLAQAIAAQEIRLQWNDNSSNEQHFEIERRGGGSGTFQRIATVPQNVASYLDEAVSPETTYRYRVRGLNAGCPSNYSATAIVMTPAIGEARPSDLSAQALSASEILLHWTDRASSESGYEVQMRPADGEFMSIQALPADSENTTVSGLTAATAYTFRVRATGGTGNSAFSNLATATTFFADPEPCVPGPTTLCLQGDRFKVEVDWLDFEGNMGSASDVGLASPDSGLLYFFNPANWEMLVKVIDGCAFNGRFWVFAAATTNVEYTLRVTDTMSGAMQEYSNPLGTAAAAITDVLAFANCP